MQEHDFYTLECITIGRAVKLFRELNSHMLYGQLYMKLNIRNSTPYTQTEISPVLAELTKVSAQL
jgi:hypothetical protein